MNAQDAGKRLLHLQHLGETDGLVVHGFLQGQANTIIHDFAAGRVDIEPPVTKDQPRDADYRLCYKSWDGQRERDLTDLSDEQFVAFMRSEPAGLVELK